MAVKVRWCVSHECSAPYPDAGICFRAFIQTDHGFGYGTECEWVELVGRRRWRSLWR